MPGDQTKGRHLTILAYCLAALKAAENPQSARAKRQVRDAAAAEFGITPRTAYRTASKAAKILAGAPVGEWGGRREDAGAPKGNQNALRKPEGGGEEVTNPPLSY